jgi:hypothetical protein
LGNFRSGWRKTGVDDGFADQIQNLLLSVGQFD